MSKPFHDVTEKENQMKYPRTPHLPWSPGVTGDDIHNTVKPLEWSEIVITENMDGENTTMRRVEYTLDP